MRTRLDNETIADALERVGDLLGAQDANRFRVRAYHRAAGILRGLPVSAVEVLETEGLKGLERIPGIGRSLASAVEELALTGRLGILERLEGQVSPEDLFTTIPGLGETLAARIHETLHIDTLEELEQAAGDGSLERVPGIGPRRARAVREILAAQLGRWARRRQRRRRFRAGQRRGEQARPGADGEVWPRPSVALLLAVDGEYRLKDAMGALRTIRPRRFNPEGKAWLPVFHTERDGWWFTALYSNTRRAHELGRTRDWVVIFYEADGHEDQCTVVTEYRGELAGRRVVRGRELECYDYYYPPPHPGLDRRLVRSSRHSGRPVTRPGYGW